MIDSGDTLTWPNEITVTNDLHVNIDEHGVKHINQYFKIGEIGKGSTSKVKLYQGQSSKVAFKIFNKSSLVRKRHKYSNTKGGMRITTAWHQVQNEIDILLSLKRHKSICPLLEILDSEDSNKLYLVFLFLAGGPLMNLDSKSREFYNGITGTVLDIPMTVKYGFQIADALAFLHQRQIIHRDIKPSNILLSHDGQNAFLSDLGVSLKVSLEGDVAGTEGTHVFFSPEICHGGTYNGYAADMWAFGVTLYICMFGRLPFYNEVPTELFELIQNCEPNFRIKPETFAPHSKMELLLTNANVSGISQFLNSFLAKDASARITAEKAPTVMERLLQSYNQTFAD